MSQTDPYRSRGSTPWRRLACVFAFGVSANVVLGQSVAATEVMGPPTPTAGEAAQEIYIPNISQFAPPADSPETLTNTLQILVMMTVLTVAPSIFLMSTCFIRIIVVLALLRQALGTQSLPPGQVIAGLSLLLTVLVMAPTWTRINDTAIQPYVRGEMAQLDALAQANHEMREFMFAQIEAAGNEEDIYMMTEYALQESIPSDRVLARHEVPTVALAPAFVLSELKTAFIIGFRMYLPFLVIDMVISTILVSMGMMMLPPVLISLPFKLLLFVLADGWRLVVGSLMAGVV